MPEIILISKRLNEALPRGREVEGRVGSEAPLFIIFSIS